jgi:uncharacterized OB-fold protein
MSGRPLPVPDERSAGYWRATRAHVLAIARCSRCGVFSHPPDDVCAACGDVDPQFVFEPVSGEGTLRSWTTVRQALLPGFEDEVPYVLVDVELDAQAGLRITGRLLDGDGRELRLGARVRVAFEDVAPDVAVPAFTLVP